MKKFILGSLLAMSSAAHAGTCQLSITRTACPGKETEAFKPYDGKTTTEETKSTPDAAACGKHADKTAKIVRKGTLTKKEVMAKFDGAPVEGGKTFADSADCK